MKSKFAYFVILLCVLALLAPAAQGEEGSLRQYAEDCLTEVFGYSWEEAQAFVYEAQPDGSLHFWPKDHPSWVYTVCITAQGQHDCTTPFDTGYNYYCGENGVRDMLNLAREKGWFAHWSEESRRDLLAACRENEVHSTLELYFAQNASQAVQAFFESCYGPGLDWTDALYELRDSVLQEYGLEKEPLPFHLAGVHREAHLAKYQQTHSIVVFDGAVPEELEAVFATPHLDGWTCHSGALNLDEFTDQNGRHFSYGLAAFEKDGRRQLVQLVAIDGEWAVYPLGENALYPQGDYRVTFNTAHGDFAIEYRLSEDETAIFYVDPRYDDYRGFEQVYTWIQSYERFNRKTGEAVWIDAAYTDYPTFGKEVFPGGLKYPVAQFPVHLGAVPITGFPTTLEAARQRYAALPEGYTVTSGVNLRVKTSTRSTSLGSLHAGVLLPVLEIVPGNPDDWIRTRVGFLEGYVSSVYTLEGQSYNNLVSPLPIAEAKKEITLKRGTGLFDGVAATFPQGTRMHVIFENGGWLYVDVPRDGLQYLMDTEGAFGYVRKDDVDLAAMGIQLDWAE